MKDLRHLKRGGVRQVSSSLRGEYALRKEMLLEVSNALLSVYYCKAKNWSI